MDEIMERKIRLLQSEVDNLVKENDRLREASDTALLDAGFYSFSHRLDSAAAYKEELTKLQADIKNSIRLGTAIEAAEGFIFNNSLAKGKKMIMDLSKLMLRAYNAEAENCVKTVRATSLDASIKRLERTAKAIERQGAMMQMRIAENFHSLRVKELTLTVDFLLKLEEEKEKARIERADLREQRRVEKELELQRESLEKEHSHYRNVLSVLDADSEERAEIEAKLKEISEAIETNDYRAANIRAGYVYVVSNIGAFGNNVVKIGMTRRVEPMDRVYELSGASVPFKFDVHALFFSEDAVSVEAELHRRFANKRVNKVNLRKEFFYADPEEVRVELGNIQGNLLEFSVEAEAEHYRLSKRLLDEESDE